MEIEVVEEKPVKVILDAFDQLRKLLWGFDAEPPSCGSCERVTSKAYIKSTYL